MTSRTAPRFLTRQDTTQLVEELARVTQDPGPTILSGNVDRAVLAAMEAARIHPALVHAFRLTGMLVSEESQDLWSRAELDRWTDAVAAYRADTPPIDAVPASGRIVAVLVNSADAAPAAPEALDRRGRASTSSPDGGGEQ